MAFGHEIQFYQSVFRRIIRRQNNSTTYRPHLMQFVQKKLRIRLEQLTIPALIFVLGSTIICSVILFVRFYVIFSVQPWSLDIGDWESLASVYNSLLAIPFTVAVALIAIVTLKSQGREYERKRIEDFTALMISNHRSLVEAATIDEKSGRKALTFLGQKVFLQSLLYQLKDKTKNTVVNGDLNKINLPPQLISVMINYANNPDQNFIPAFKPIADVHNYPDKVLKLKEIWPSIKEDAKRHIYNYAFSDREIAKYFHQDHEVCHRLYSLLNSSQKQQILSDCYDDLYEKHGSEIGPIFRNTYYLLQELDEYGDSITGHRLASIARSQLSRFELVLFLLNFCGAYCKPNFRRLIMKFDYLDGLHLNDALIFETENDYKAYLESAIGKNDVPQSMQTNSLVASIR